MLAVANVEISSSSGLVKVFSGIFLHAGTTDDELAAVLAHEIAHVLANHTMEGVSVVTVATVFSLPFVPFALFGYLVPEALIFALPIIGAFSVNFALSRKRETEADYIGMMLMADAGFDLSAAVNVWKKMKEMEYQMLSADPRLQQDPQWMSTHPHVSFEHRAKIDYKLTSVPPSPQRESARTSVGSQKFFRY